MDRLLNNGVAFHVPQHMSGTDAGTLPGPVGSLDNQTYKGESKAVSDKTKL